MQTILSCFGNCKHILSPRKRCEICRYRVDNYRSVTSPRSSSTIESICSLVDSSDTLGKTTEMSSSLSTSCTCATSSPLFSLASSVNSSLLLVLMVPSRRSPLILARCVRFMHGLTLFRMSSKSFSVQSILPGTFTRPS
jgi:hypothetical protein